MIIVSLLFPSTVFPFLSLSGVGGYLWIPTQSPIRVPYGTFRHTELTWIVSKEPRQLYWSTNTAHSRNKKWDHSLTTWKYKITAWQWLHDSSRMWKERRRSLDNDMFEFLHQQSLPLKRYWMASPYSCLLYLRIRLYVGTKQQYTVFRVTVNV